MNKTETIPHTPSAGLRTEHPAVATLFAVEGLGSIGATMLQMGIFFYTTQFLGWGPLRNFALAAGQGAVYVVASLLSHGLSLRIGPRRMLIAWFTVLVALCAAAGLAASAHASVLLAALLIVFTFISAGTWPVLEGMVSAGTDPVTMSRRIGIYNLTWSGSGAAALAISGTIMSVHPLGIFVVPMLVNAAAVMLLWRVRTTPRPFAESIAAPRPEPPPSVHGDAQLLQLRTLALWLSRISLPAVYVINYSLGAMMPSLPVMRDLGPAAQTFLGSIWMIARFAAFILAGMTTAWHVRPRILLASAGAMLIAFLGVTSQGSALLHIAMPQTIERAAMVGWQVALGLSMGMIYAGSLYFGMVLSDGSSEHGGYHEALIGVGQTLGPASAALATWLRPEDLTLGICTVGGIVALTVTAAALASVTIGRNAPMRD